MRPWSPQHKGFRLFAAPLLLGLQLWGLPRLVQAEELTLATYYPSPRGVYQEVRTVNNALLATVGGGVGIGAGTSQPLGKLSITGALDNPNFFGSCHANSIWEDVDKDSIGPEPGECREVFLTVSSAGNMALGGPNAPAGFTVMRKAVLFTTDYMGAPFAEDVPVSGAGARFMWIPARSALRAGEVTSTHWDAANVGFNSIALGFNVKADGAGSVAIGGGVRAGPLGAIGIGYDVTATDGFAIGREVESSGAVATAIGYRSQARGDNSTALASGRALNTFSFAVEGEASGYSSMAIGGAAKATGHYSTAIGQFVESREWGSFTIGGDWSGATTLVNDKADSLMIGMRSNLPTLVVGPSGGAGTTGNVGIGTSTPLSTAPPVPFPDPQGGGNLDVNDIYLRSRSRWVSQLSFGGGGAAALKCQDSSIFASGTGDAQCAAEFGSGAACIHTRYPNTTSLMAGILCGETSGTSRRVRCCWNQ